jgi:hypothetical protein
MVVGPGPEGEALDGGGTAGELAGLEVGRALAEELGALDAGGGLEEEREGDDVAEEEGEDVWVCVRCEDADGEAPLATAPQPARHTARLVRTATRTSFPRNIAISSFLLPYYIAHLVRPWGG